jgi:RNA polymerase sigma-70 factor (ECF subfamily)
MNTEAEAERVYLLRLCAYLTGSAEAAEDLVQETLIEAWRHEDGLRDPERRRAWLSGIARNVCKRWLRRQDRASLKLEMLPTESHPKVDGDIEADLERSELVQLLDRALALLPADTRDVLVARFVQELPHAEIAERLRMSEGAVKVRVHRGKISLRHLLTTRFAAELAGYGPPADPDEWQETRIWCMTCAAGRMQMRVSPDGSTISFRCARCDLDSQVSSNYPLLAPELASVTPGVTRPSQILRRGAEWSHRYFAEARDGGTLPCTRCGTLMRVEVIPPADDMGDVLTDRLQAVCDACDAGASVSRTGLVTALPEVRDLRRRESRLRILPARRLEADGRPAVVTSVGSVAGTARIDVVTDADTYRVITLRRDALPEQL